MGECDTIDADEDEQVVAAFERIEACEFQVRQAAGQDRAAAVQGFEGAVLEFMLLGGGEFFRQVLLVFRKYVNHEPFALAKCLQAAGTVVQADQNNRRVQGNRGEGIDGDADGHALRRQPGDHGDAGGESAEGLAE